MSSRLSLWSRLFVSEALRSLLRHKLRTVLAALGVTIGVAAVIWVVSISQAGARETEEQLHQLGDNLIWIEAGSRTVNGVRTGTRGMNTLTPEDADAIRNEVRDVIRVSENVDGTVLTERGDQNWSTRYRGVSPDYAEIKNWPVTAGNFLDTSQVRSAENVVVLGETVRNRLFGQEAGVGSVVRIQGFPFVVIGILSQKGQSAWGWDQDDTVMLPWTTALKKLRGKGFTSLDDIVCSASSGQAIDPATESITRLLHQRHAIVSSEDDDFNVRKPYELARARAENERTMSALLVALAIISLLVGGIGIMNVMLASVVQRTPEIGVRVAVGATPALVQLQFLGEAVMLCLSGGLLGVGLAAAGVSPLEEMLGFGLTLPAEAALVAVGFAVAVGVSFGFYPAWRAARVDPIAALHHE